MEESEINRRIEEHLKTRQEQEANVIEEANQKAIEKEDIELQAFCNPGAIVLISDQASQDINFLLRQGHVLNLNRIQAISARLRGEYQMKNAVVRLKELAEKERYLSRLMDQSTSPPSTISGKLSESMKALANNFISPSSTSQSKNVTQNTNSQMKKSGKGSKKNKKSDGITATIPISGSTIPVPKVYDELR